MPFDPTPCDKKSCSEHQTLFPLFGEGSGHETNAYAHVVSFPNQRPVHSEIASWPGSVGTAGMVVVTAKAYAVGKVLHLAGYL